jgi:hypothetical protein
VTEARLPRAMALADRASALAPDDPTVTALVQTVTQGGQASRRKRRLALGGVAVALAGGVTALGLGLASSATTAPLDAAHGDDAAIALEPPRAPEAPGDPVIALDAAVVATTTRGDARSEPEPDARGPLIPPLPRLPSDAAVRRIHDAVALPPDAAPLIDAHAPPELPELDAAIEPAAAAGRVIVRNDLWCNVWIDGIDRGNRRNESIEVAPGHHVVRCVNPVGEWTQETDVASGTTRTLAGSLLRELEVTLEVDATIDGKPYHQGAVLRLKPGNVEVVAGGKKKFITFRTSCTLKDTPELGCYL